MLSYLWTADTWHTYPNINKAALRVQWTSHRTYIYTVSEDYQCFINYTVMVEPYISIILKSVSAVHHPDKVMDTLACITVLYTVASHWSKSMQVYQMSIHKLQVSDKWPDKTKRSSAIWVSVLSGILLSAVSPHLNSEFWTVVGYLCELKPDITSKFANPFSFQNLITDFWILHPEFRFQLFLHLLYPQSPESNPIPLLNHVQNMYTVTVCVCIPGHMIFHTCHDYCKRLKAHPFFLVAAHDQLCNIKKR